MRDVKVIPGKEIAKQHHLLVCDLHVPPPPPPPHSIHFPPPPPPPPPPPTHTHTHTHTTHPSTHVDPPPPPKKKFVPHLRTWHLKDPEAQSEYQKAFITETTTGNSSGNGTEDIWENLKSSLPKAHEIVWWSTKKHQWQKETCWWSAAVDSAVKETRRSWKTWKNGGNKEEYQKAQHLAKHSFLSGKISG